MANWRDGLKVTAVETEPKTRPSLLVRIRDLEDREAWDQFVGIYAPLIKGFARSRGLQDADAGDITQDILRQVMQQIERFDYDPKHGAFRGWLYTLTRNRIRNFVTRELTKGRGSGDTVVRRRLEEVPDESEDRAEWDREYDRQLFAAAVRRVQPHFRECTWTCFWATTVQARPAAEVAEELGISVGAVYIAKSRVLARLRLAIDQIGDQESHPIE